MVCRSNSDVLMLCYIYCTPMVCRSNSHVLMLCYNCHAPMVCRSNRDVLMLCYNWHAPMVCRSNRDVLMLCYNWHTPMVCRSNCDVLMLCYNCHALMVHQHAQSLPVKHQFQNSSAFRIKKWWSRVVNVGRGTKSTRKSTPCRPSRWLLQNKCQSWAPATAWGLGTREQCHTHRRRSLPSLLGCLIPGRPAGAHGLPQDTPHLDVGPQASTSPPSRDHVFSTSGLTLTDWFPS
jgi:hypothetical protein